MLVQKLACVPSILARAQALYGSYTHKRTPYNHIYVYVCVHFSKLTIILKNYNYNKTKGLREPGGC